MHPPSLTALRTEFDVVDDTELGTDRDRLLPLLHTAEALVVRNKTRVDIELLDRAPQLRVIARLGVGLDNIDLEGCRERRIAVEPATGANATAVAEYVIGALLTLIRGVFGESHRVVAGEWPRHQMNGGELAGKLLGLIGYGLISREVAERASALGMLVMAHDPFIDRSGSIWGTTRPVEFDELITSADAISVHVPLTDSTRHLIDAERISMMRPGAFLVNTARGGVVDEAGVIEGLTSGRLGGAALDVFENEPLDEWSGGLFDQVPDLILTPHIAGITGESERRIGEMTVATVRRHLRDPR